MLAEHTEDVGILSLVESLDILRHLASLAQAKLQLSAHLLVGAEVEFGDVYLVNNLRILLDSCIEILHAREVDVVVTLHTDTVDGCAHLLHLFHHIIYTVALAWLAGIIIVVEKFDIGVSLACKLEHLYDKLLAA